MGSAQLANLDQPRMQTADVHADALCSIIEQNCPSADLTATCSEQIKKQVPDRVPQTGAFRQHQDLDVLIRAGQAHGQVVAPLLSAQHGTVPFNSCGTFAFETPLFKGQAQVLLRNLPNTPRGVFEGKRRQMMVNIQGRFKQPDIPLDSLMLGSFFARPLKVPSGALITKAASWLAHRLGGGVRLEPLAPQPLIAAPLIAAAQVVNVALPGQQPELGNPHEDLTLFNPGLINSWTGKPLAPSRRRSHFSSAANRKGRCFDRQHVWTFQLYEHVLDYSTFLVNIPLVKLDVVQILDGQPLQLHLKDISSGLSLLHLDVWHKRMLNHPANSNKGPVTAAAGGGSDNDSDDVHRHVEAC